MVVTEKRLVEQGWYETEYTKTGWDSHGWFFKDSRESMDDSWTVIELLDYDKFYNPMLGIAEKETETE